MLETHDQPEGFPMRYCIVEKPAGSTKAPKLFSTHSTRSARDAYFRQCVRAEERHGLTRK